MQIVDRFVSALVTAIVGAAIFLPTIGSAQTCDEIGQLVTTTPAPPPDVQRWRHNINVFKSAVQAKVDLVLIGDSLAEAWNIEMWRPMRVVNLGVGGDRTQHVLWRLQSANWSRLRPRAILIMLGTNNLFVGDDSCAITAGLKRVIKQAHAIWPSTQIGLLEIPPRGQDFLFRNDARTQINASLRHIPGLKTINVDDAISCNWKSPCINYASDNVHFSDAGYEILLKAAKQALFDK